MALDKIKVDGSETGGSSADKINAAFDVVDTLEASNDLISAEAFNNTLAVIPKGAALKSDYAATAGVPNVGLAQADNIANAKVVGVAIEDIQPNTSGLVAGFGIIEGLDTSLFEIGKYLYLSETEPGVITNVSPLGIISVVGLTMLSAVDGKLMVAISNFRSLPIAYASMKGGSAAATIDTAWQDIANYTSQNDVIMESDLLSGQISCKISGSYEIDYNLDLSFNTSGQGQTRTKLFLRMVGDDGYISDSIPLGLQNSAVTGSFTPSFMGELLAGVNYRAQISSDRTLTDVVYEYVSVKVEAKHLELDI